MFYTLIGMEGTTGVKSPRCSHQCPGFELPFPPGVVDEELVSCLKPCFFVFGLDLS